MIHLRNHKGSYSEMKRRLGKLDAEILERLVERGDTPEDVMRDLCKHEGMTEHRAFNRVRNVLLNSMDKLHQPTW